MPARPCLFLPKLLLISATLSLGEDKPESNQPRPEPRTQQSTIQTTTHNWNWANIPTFSTAMGTKSQLLRKRHKLAQNTNATTSTQPCPPHRTKNSETENNQRKTTSKTPETKENQQPADDKNLPRNSTTTHSPASAKTPPQSQNNTLRQGQSLVTTLCASCHSTMLVYNARKTNVDWRKTLSKMETQGMPKLPLSLQEPLIQYLTTALGIPIDNSRQNYGPWADRRNTNPLW